MSTRCQVRIVENGYPLNLYHHCDGYFSGVGCELQEILKKNKESNGLCSASYIINDLITHEYSGYEVTFANHGDIEYFYLMDFDKKEFKAFRTIGYNMWAGEGDDEYDQYQPWYNQIPRHDKELDLLNDKMVDID